MSDTAKIESATVELYLETTSMRLDVGLVARQQLKLVNQTPRLANFDLTARGVPANWLRFSQTNVNLFPTWSESVELELTAPAGTPPGRYTLEINVQATGEEQVQNSLRLDLEVTPPSEPLNSAIPADWSASATTPVVASTYSASPVVEDYPTEKPLPNWLFNSTSSVAAPVPEPTDAPVSPSNSNTNGHYQEAAPYTYTPPPTMRLFAPSDPPPAAPDPWPVEPVLAELPPPIEENQPTETEAAPASELPITTVEDLLPQTGQVELTMPIIQMSLRPGESAVQELTLRNLGDNPDQLELYVQGLPPDWYSFSSRILDLFPGWSVPVQFTLSVPAQTDAAHYPGQLAVLGGRPKRVLSLADFEVEVRELPPPVATPTPQPRSTGRLSALAASQPRLTGRLSALPTPQPRSTGRLSAQPSPTEQPPAPPVAKAGRQSLWQRMFKPTVEPVATPPVAEPQNEVVFAPAELPPAPLPVVVEPFAAFMPPVEPPLPTPPLPVDRPLRVIRPATPMPVEEVPPALPERVILPATGLALVRPPILPVEPTLPLSVEANGLRLGLEKPQLKIYAGGFVEQQINVTNLSSIPDNFSLSFEGLPAEWVHFSGTSVNLFPNWVEELYLRIDVPVETQPDHYQVFLKVVSDTQPDQIFNQIELSLTIREASGPLPVIPEVAEDAGGQVLLKVENPQMLVIPGQSFEQQLTLDNLTGQADTFELALEGVPPDWASFSCLTMTLFPGWHEEFYLRLQIPAEPRKAQDFRLKVTARPALPERSPVALDLLLKVRNEDELDLELVEARPTLRLAEPEAAIEVSPLILPPAADLDVASRR